MSKAGSEGAEMAPEDFDLDAAMAGIVAATTTVSVPTRGDLASRYADLDRERLALERAGDDVGAADRTAEEVADEMADLAEQWEATSLRFVLREPTPKIAKGVRKKHVDDGGEIREGRWDEFLRDMTVAAIITPSGVTRAKLDALEEKVGQVAFAELLSATMTMGTQRPAISVPFSRKSSRSQAGSEPA